MIILAIACALTFSAPDVVVHQSLHRERSSFRPQRAESGSYSYPKVPRTSLRFVYPKPGPLERGVGWGLAGLGGGGMLGAATEFSGGESKRGFGTVSAGFIGWSLGFALGSSGTGDSGESRISALPTIALMVLGQVVAAHNDNDYLYVPFVGLQIATAALTGDTGR